MHHVEGERLTCDNMTEQHLPEGFVLASEEPEEQGVQLSCGKLQCRKTASAQVMYNSIVEEEHHQIQCPATGIVFVEHIPVPCS